MKKDRGITLIALVITIIIVIILAGAVILTITSNNPINLSKEAKFKSDMKNLASKVNLVIIDKILQNEQIQDDIIKGEKLEEYIPELKNTGYKVYIKNKKLTINKIDGYTEEEIKWAKEIDIRVEGILEESSLKILASQNEINIIIEDSYIEDIDKYYYKITKLSGASALDGGFIESENNTHAFDNLESGAQYKVEVKVVRKGEESGVISRLVKTLNKVQINGIPTNWTNQNATLSLEYGIIPNGYIMQYKFGIGIWIEYNTPVIVTQNTTIHARLYNSETDEEMGTNSEDIVSIDKSAPNDASITLPTSAETSDFTATVVQSDSLSGVNVANSKYKLSQSNVAFGVDSNEWNSADGTFTNINQQLNLKVSDGTYYLHVLSIDNVGNKIETVSSNSIVVKVEINDSYIKPGLLVWYDGINNEKDTHNNNATIWYDLSGNGNHATPYYCKWNEDSLELNGAGSWVKIKEMDYPNITLQAVFMWDEAKANNDIISNFESGGYGLSNYATSYWKFMIYINGAYINVPSTTGQLPNLNTGEKYMLSGSYNGSTIKYMQNENIITESKTGKIGYPISTVLALGTNPSGVNPSISFLKGKIYSIRIYDRALTDEELRHNYEIDKKRFGI